MIFITIIDKINKFVHRGRSGLTDNPCATVFFLYHISLYPLALGTPIAPPDSGDPTSVDRDRFNHVSIQKKTTPRTTIST